MKTFWKWIKIGAGVLALVVITGLIIALEVLSAKNRRLSGNAPVGGLPTSAIGNDLSGQAGRISQDIEHLHADNGTAISLVDKLRENNQRLADWIHGVQVGS
jgi:hypothetical protein